MAKEIKNSEGDKVQFSFVFTKTNYIIMIVGLVLLALGYLLLCGGGSDDPNVFNAEMFNGRRLFVSPILIFLGFVTEIVAIMYEGKK
jgi:predicted membrane protein